VGSASAGTLFSRIVFAPSALSALSLFRFRSISTTACCEDPTLLWPAFFFRADSLLLFIDCVDFGSRVEEAGRLAGSSSEEGTSQVVSCVLFGDGRTSFPVGTRAGDGARSTDARICSPCQVVIAGFGFVGGLSSRKRVYGEDWCDDLP
jgi:hypothetical protein